jgi:hypothetical protein
MSPQIHRFLFPRSPITTLAAALAAAALLPTPALADQADVYVADLLSERIEVTSNGTDYVGANGFANLVADVRIVIDTESAGRVKYWKIWLGLWGEHSNALWFPQYGASKSYAWNKRPRRVDRTEQLIVPSGLWSGYVTARCNALADSLRAQGLGNTAIFAEDRTLQVAVPVDFDIDTTGAGQGNIIVEGTGGWSGQAKVDLVCKKWAGAAIPQANTNLGTEPAKVVGKSLAIAERSGLNGVCKIRLDGTITTDHLNVDVSFRYKDKAGHESQLWTVNTGESKTAGFSHWYNVPNNEGSETGSIRMVGASHDFTSAWVDYEMDCVEGGPSTLTSNDPPKLTIKSIEEEGKVMVAGQICPERLRLVGEVEGRGNFSGYAAFLAASGPFWISPPQAYDLDPDETQLVVGYYPIWSGTVVKLGSNEPIKIARSFVFRATNTNNAIVASVDRMYASECKPPKLNPVVQGGQGGLTVEPRRPAAPATAPRILQQQPASPTQPRRMQLVPLRQTN